MNEQREKQKEQPRTVPVRLNVDPSTSMTALFETLRREFGFEFKFSGGAITGSNPR